MASKNKDERAHVNALIKVLREAENAPLAYFFIDRDAGNVRHTSSGWDFHISYAGRVVYCEAKEEKGKLTSWQEVTRAMIHSAGNLYRVVRFWKNGEFFNVDGGKMIAIKDACLQDFF